MIQTIYILSIIFMLVSTTLYKKSEKKINIVKFIVVLIIVLLSYNQLVCYIFNTINMPITLGSLSFINIIVGLIPFIIFIKNREYQKYEIKGKDSIALLIILIVVILVSYLNFGKELHIKYLTTDAGVHYKAAREFYQNEKLLNKTLNTSISKEFMIGAYTNTGILFKLASPIMGELNLYKIFICFDLFIFFLIGITMYVSIEHLSKGKLGYVLSIIAVIIFMLGYPLNSLIYGYVYLQLGILIVMAIITIYKTFENSEFGKLKYIFLFVLNFGIFFTYCIFIPIVYFAEGLYFLIKEYKEKKRAFTLNSIKIISLILVIPFILGIIYFVLPHLLKGNGEVFITVEGYIYRNIWSNFVFVLPLSLIYLIKKDKDISINEIFFITLIVFMLFMLVITYGLNLSTYYYCKNNFLLWFILWRKQHRSNKYCDR